MSDATYAQFRHARRRWIVRCWVQAITLQNVALGLVAGTVGTAAAEVALTWSWPS